MRSNDANNNNNNSKSNDSAPRAQDDSPQQPGRPSLLSGLHRPTLAGVRSGGDIRADFEETLSIPARPRRLWKVSDTGVPVIPPFYPIPLNPRLCAYVADASPSVVAVRIAEGLRRQSIAVEFDEEAVTATCMTVDQCRFVIHLWQAKAPSSNSTGVLSLVTNPSAPEINALPKPDSQPGLLVEFRRVDGDTMTFHYVVSALKKAAKSHGTGQEFRKPRQTSPMEFPRFMAAITAEKPTSPGPDPSNPSPKAIEGLEHALGLLRKDRLDAQLRGMEEVLCLSDMVTSGLDIAFTVSLAIIGAPIEAPDGASSDDFVSAAQALHQNWIYRLLVDRELPDEAGDGPPPLDENAEEARTGLAFLCGFGGEHDASNLNDKQIEQMREDRVRMGDEYHGGKMRCMALRSLANALVLLSRHNPKALYMTLSTHGSAMISEELFLSLWHDAAGASRPPGVVAGTRLASPHEAAIAIRCIRLLGQAHPKAKQRLIKHKKSALEQLEKCYFIGQAVHEILEYEAKRTYRFLTANF
ncbi:hypothetical protein ACA910_014543 [Epithemia clementina (nom. ined.)]